MEFKTFQSNCKYAQYELKDDTTKEFELTCHNPECIPNKQFLERCSVFCCPYFSLKFISGEMKDKETGKVIMTFNEGKIIHN